MIKRAEEWDEPTVDSHNNPSNSGSHAKYPGDSDPFCGKSLPLHGLERSIAGPRLSITFKDISPTPHAVTLVPHEPLVCSVLDEQGRVTARYELLTAKLSALELTAVEQVLSESIPTRAKVPPLEVMRAIVASTRDNSHDCWRSQPGEAPYVATDVSQRMTLHIPDINRYLANPARLGRIYHSEGKTNRTRYRVAILLEPKRNRALFRLTLRHYGDENLVRTEKIAIYCPAGGPTSTAESLRRLRELAWRSLEKLWDGGPDEFRRYTKQLKASLSSTYTKNLCSGASLTTRTTPQHTTITITSCTSTANSQDQEPGARYQWRFPGNMDHPQHPLNTLLAGVKKAIRQPEADGQLTHAFGELVTAARTYPHSRMTSWAARLDGLLDASTLRLLHNLPGVRLHSPRPGLGESPSVSEDTSQSARLVHSIVEILHGVSRFELFLQDFEFLHKTPQAFSTLAVILYPDRSAIIQAESALGFSATCSLSEASRFVRVLALDVLQPICAAFARQQIMKTPTEGRLGLLQMLNQLVQFDPKNSSLTYSGACAPPPLQDETANQLFDNVAVPLIVQLQEICGKQEVLFRVKSQTRNGIELVLAHHQCPLTMQIVYSEGQFHHLSVLEKSEQSPHTHRGRFFTQESLDRRTSLRDERVFTLPASRNVSAHETIPLLRRAVAIYGHLTIDRLKQPHC
jgi:hypothetical protein